MQDEINEKCVMVTVNAAKMTTKALADALTRIVQDLEERGNVNRARDGTPATYRGKVLVRDLAKEGELSNIEITDGNIRSFEKHARKYGVTYALKKDRTREPPRYMVFFKAKEISQMEAAFKEYTGWQMKNQEAARPSILKKLQEKVAIAAKMAQKEKVKERVRGDAR